MSSKKRQSVRKILTKKAGYARSRLRTAATKSGEDDQSPQRDEEAPSTPSPPAWKRWARILATSGIIGFAAKGALDFVIKNESALAAARNDEVGRVQDLATDFWKSPPTSVLQVDANLHMLDHVSKLYTEEGRVQISVLRSDIEQYRSSLQLEADKAAERARQAALEAEAKARSDAHAAELANAAAAKAKQQQLEAAQVTAKLIERATRPAIKIFGKTIHF